MYTNSISMYNSKIVLFQHEMNKMLGLMKLFKKNFGAELLTCSFKKISQLSFYAKKNLPHRDSVSTSTVSSNNASYQRPEA